ncbi:hypothetical protein BC941DRAFT_420231 [Chlamydoabsidia padenii]|nr:hypothetical protein BC941DRAFT_420231 [Chlamydoabsidia padenii]
MSTIDTPILTNKRATQKSSLYHTCRHVLLALSTIDCLQTYLTMPDTMTETTPMSRLWYFCRQGISLWLLFNTFKPENPIPPVEDKPKVYVYHFIIACKNQLNFDRVFTPGDVFQDNTNGFVRVVNVLQQVVEMMENEGIIVIPNQCSDMITAPKDTRDKIVTELLETERKYVEDLETLQNYMEEVRSQDILPPDTIHQLFGNLDDLVDSQRKFMMEVEAQGHLAPQEQRFGQLFIQQEQKLAVYEPFCANFQTAQTLVCREHVALEKLSHLLSSSFELQSYLIKPVQRICKYPLLMKELVKTTPSHWTFYNETKLGLEAIQRVAASVNETRRQQENFTVVQELKEQVDYWLGSDIDNFGTLHLHDKFIVYRGDSGRELIVYLFDKCLFICREEKEKDTASSSSSSTNGKDSNGKKAQKKNKKNDGGLSTSSSSTSATSNDPTNNSTTTRLCVRGRIQMSRVVQVIDISQDGNCFLQIFWSEKCLQSGQQYRLEYFILKCRHQEQVQLWESSLNGLIKQIKKQVPCASSPQLSTVPSSHCLTRLDSSSSSTYNNSSIRDDNNRYRIYPDTPLSRQQSNDTSLGITWTPLSRQNGSQFSGFLPSPALRVSSNSQLSRFEGMDDPSHTVPATELVTQHVLNEHQMEEHDDYFDDDYDMYSSSITTPGTPMSFNSLSQHTMVEKPLPQIMMINNSNDSDLVQYRLRSQSSPNIHPPNNDTTIPSMPLQQHQDITRFDKRRSNGDQECSRPLYSFDYDTSLQQQDFALSLESTTKVKLHHADDTYILLVPLTIKHKDLVKRIEKKIKCDNLTNTSLAPYVLKYRDEDNDMVTIHSDEDLKIGLECRGVNNTVNLYIV